MNVIQSLARDKKLNKKRVESAPSRGRDTVSQVLSVSAIRDGVNTDKCVSFIHNSSTPKTNPCLPTQFCAIRTLGSALTEAICTFIFYRRSYEKQLQKSSHYSAPVSLVLSQFSSNIQTMPEVAYSGAFRLNVWVNMDIWTGRLLEGFNTSVIWLARAGDSQSGERSSEKRRLSCWAGNLCQRPGVLSWHWHKHMKTGAWQVSGHTLASATLSIPFSFSV